MLVSEKLVEEFHTVLDILGAASDEDLDAFRIPQTELRPLVTSVQRDPYRHAGRTFYSTDSKTDDYYRHDDRISNSAEIAGGTPRLPLIQQNRRKS